MLSCIWWSLKWLYFFISFDHKHIIICFFNNPIHAYPEVINQYLLWFHVVLLHDVWIRKFSSLNLWFQCLNRISIFLILFFGLQMLDIFIFVQSVSVFRLFLSGVWFFKIDQTILLQTCAHIHPFLVHRFFWSICKYILKQRRLRGFLG